VLIGASSVAQLDDSLGALGQEGGGRGLAFDDAELTRIDEHAVEAGINLWKRSAEA
jgi:L-glyceraldehyde 3-phosphate reductase